MENSCIGWEWILSLPFPTNFWHFLSRFKKIFRINLLRYENSVVDLMNPKFLVKNRDHSGTCPQHFFPTGGTMLDPLSFRSEEWMGQFK